MRLASRASDIQDGGWWRESFLGEVESKCGGSRPKGERRKKKKIQTSFFFFQIFRPLPESKPRFATRLVMKSKMNSASSSGVGGRRGGKGGAKRKEETVGTGDGGLRSSSFTGSLDSSDGGDEEAESMAEVSEFVARFMLHHR